MEVGKTDTQDRIPESVESQSIVETMEAFCSDFAEIERKLAERGVIGSVAPRNYGLMGYIPQVNRLISGTGPEMADALAADGVDICLLSPG